MTADVPRRVVLVFLCLLRPAFGVRQAVVQCQRGVPLMLPLGFPTDVLSKE